MTQSVDASAVASSIAAPAEAPAAETSPAPQTEQGSPEPSDGVENTQATPPQQAENDDFVRRFNALSRKERELLAKEQEIKSKYGEYESYQKERAKLQENPLEFLESNGWKFQDLAEYVLNDNKPTTETQVSKLQRRIDEIEAERKAEIAAREEAKKKEQEHKTITAFKNNIKETLSSNSEQYELINHFDEYDTVYDVIENYYSQNGEILDIARAAAEVEKHLEQQFERAASTNKFKKRYSPIEQAMAEAAEQQSHESKPQDNGFASTLTNDVVSSPASTKQPEQTYLSDEESKAKAAEILREWMLKKKGYTKN